MDFLLAVGTEIICLRFRVRFRVRVRFSVRVSVRVNYLRDSFSVLLRPQHHSMLSTAGRVHTSYFILNLPQKRFFYYKINSLREGFV